MPKNRRGQMPRRTSRTVVTRASQGSPGTKIGGPNWQDVTNVRAREAKSSMVLNPPKPKKKPK